MSVAKNNALVTNICDYNQHEFLTIYTNWGSQVYNQVADLIMFPIKVHYNPASMATILSFKAISSLEAVHITMDTYNKTVFITTLQDRQV